MNTRTVSNRAWAALILGICLSAGVASGEQPVVTNQPIALSGQPAPGGEAGETFLSFQGPPAGPSPVMNARGDVAFVSVVSRPPGGPVEVLFLHRNGVLERVAEQGAAVPGQPNLLFGKMSNLAINDFGEVMFVNLAEGSSLLGKVGGAWRVMALSRTQAPGLPEGEQFLSVSSNLGLSGQQFLFRSDGALGAAFHARTRMPPAPDKEGLWLVNSPATEPFRLLDYGGPAPDLTGGEALINSAALFSVALGSAPAGILAFDGRIAGTGVNSTNDQVLWAGPPTDPKVVARSGQPAPPSIPGRFYQGFRELGVNGAGQLCFVADLSRFSVDQALFTSLPTDLTLVARTGDELPGGGELRSIDATVINLSGQVGFLATVSPGGFENFRGIYLWTPSTGLKLVVRAGGDCPGAPEGWTFQELGLQELASWNLNNAGRVAFLSGAISPDGSAGGTGWWITDTNGTPVLLAQSGIPQSADPQGVLAAEDQLSGGQGVVYRVSGGQDGRRRFLSDFNHLVFTAGVGGGQSGIFRAHIAGDDHPSGEEFLFSLRSSSVFARIQGAYFLDGLLNHGAFVGNSAVLRAAELKNWDGGKVSLEITANAHEQDRLGIGPSQRGISVTADGLTVLFKNVAIGEVMRRPNGLEVALNSEATTEGVFQLLRSLAYGFTEDVEDRLQANPQHTVTNRVLRLSVTDAGGRIQEAGQLVEFPKTEGLALGGIGPGNVWVDYSVLTHRTPSATLDLELQLSDGSRVSLPNRLGVPLGTEKWSTPDLPLEIQVNTSTPAATFTPGERDREFAFKVTLHDWEANGVLIWRRQFSAIEGATTNEICLALAFSLLYDFEDLIEDATLQDSRTFRGRKPAHVTQNSATDAAGPTDFLAGPYSLRAWMDQSPEGRRLIALYEEHSPELVQIVLTNSSLLNDSAGVFAEFIPGLNRFLAGQADTEVIRPDMIEQLNRVWDAFEAAGSPGLKTTLIAERARFNGFQDFVGHTFGDWGQLLEIGVPATPYITLSSPQRTNQVFSAEANRSEGLSYTLQRTPTVSPLNWTDVTNASIQHFGYRVKLADTNAVDASFLYRLQATMNPAN